MLAGLAEHGTDLRDADLVVGTSAGSVVGALITSGTDLAELYASQLAPQASSQLSGWGLRRSCGGAGRLPVPEVRSRWERESAGWR